MDQIVGFGVSAVQYAIGLVIVLLMGPLRLCLGIISYIWTCIAFSLSPALFLVSGCASMFRSIPTPSWPVLKVRIALRCHIWVYTQFRTIVAMHVDLHFLSQELYIFFGIASMTGLVFAVVIHLFIIACSAGIDMIFTDPIPEAWDPEFTELKGTVDSEL